MTSDKRRDVGAGLGPASHRGPACADFNTVGGGPLWPSRGSTIKGLPYTERALVGDFMRNLILSVLLFSFGLTVPSIAQRSGEKSAERKIAKLHVGDDVVTIYRDAYGVPRIFAQTLRGLFVGNGYAIAEDRTWQMEKYRLDAEGRLADVFGEKYLDHDKQIRRDGMTREEWRAEFDRLPPDIQEVFRAYAEGVNRYFEEARRSNTLSEEFAKNHWQPAPWTVEDSMAIGGMMGRRFGASGANHWRNEEVLEFLTRRLGARSAAIKVFNDMAWLDDPAAISTIEAEAARKSVAAANSSGVGERFALPRLRRRIPLGPEREALPYQRNSMEFLHGLDGDANGVSLLTAAQELGLPTKWGSYAWLLAPSKSASGNALLLGGPQMGFATPQIAHEVQLTGAGYNVIGMGFAGIPGVLIGMNDHLAWTSTSGASHNEDVFVEKLKPGDEHQYFYRGSYRPMEHRVERILVKDKPPVDYDVYRTVHGPVIRWSLQKDFVSTKQMAYFGKEYGTTIAFLRLNTAKQISDIPPLARQIASSHNIFVATKDGDIGFWHCGFFPVYSAGLDPRFPLRGTGEDDWQGFVPFDSLPQVVNPASGLIFNWNNKPASDWKRYSVPAWGIAFHVSNIPRALQGRLKERGGRLSFTEIQQVAPEIGRRNYIADWLKPGLLEAGSRQASSLTPEIRKALDYLRYWDNQLMDGSVAQSIFEAWYNRLRRLIFSETLGDLGDEKTFDAFVNPSTVYHALAGAQSTVPLSRDYLAGKSADEVRLRALEQALDQLCKEKGPDMTAWGYRIEWIKFDPLMPIPWYSRGTYIQAVELARPRVHGVYILPPGESENSHSPHYSDQLSLASWWMFAPMRLATESELTQPSTQ